MKQDWVEVELGEVVSKLGDGLHGTPKYSDIGDFYFINGNNLTDGKIEIKENTKRVSKEEYEKYKKPLNQNTILVSINGTIGNLAFYNNEKVILGKSACYFNLLDIIDKRYIRFLLSSLGFLNYAFKTATGSTIKNVPLKAMREYVVPIAPLPIQRALVLKIENLFASLDKGIADLEKAQQQLKVYRQAVLKKAFEGGFTNKNKKEGELPEGWKWVKLGEVANKITDGSHFSPKSVQKGYPYITVKDISNDHIDFTKCLNISEEDYKKLKANDCQPLRNDMLFSKDGTVGKVANIDFEKEFVVLSSLAIIRTNITVINPKYLFWIMKSTHFLNQALDSKKGVAIRRLILRDLKELSLTLPQSLNEQTSIVREIESRLSVCDKVEQSITESLEKAKALRQSILKKAFEGKLLSEAEVTQCKKEKDYEPASVLLERIRKDRACPVSLKNTKK